MKNSDEKFFEMHAIVRGNVQGVGFRATTRYYAKILGLSGTVRNLSDGTVDIRASGRKSRLEELMQKLNDEFGPGLIEKASIEHLPVEGPLRQEDFRIY